MLFFQLLYREIGSLQAGVRKILAKKMMKDGLIESHKDKSNKREIYYNITENGKEMLQEKLDNIDTVCEGDTKKVTNIIIKAVEELKVLYSAVSDILEMTVKAFETGNLHLAEKVEPLEEVIDGMRLELKARHISRLQKNQCTLELGFIFSDLLTNLERVADHCSNIAVCMIQLKTNSLENHEYLNMIKQSDEYFQKKFKTNSEKYALPSAE